MGPTTGDKQARAHELADQLMGTCDSLPDEVLDDADLCGHIDELVMCCDTCSWWVEPHEIDDDGNCEDCATE